MTLFLGRFCSMFTCGRHYGLNTIPLKGNYDDVIINEKHGRLCFGHTSKYIYYPCCISESELVMTFLLAAMYLYNVLSLENALCHHAWDKAFEQNLCQALLLEKKDPKCLVCSNNGRWKRRVKGTNKRKERYNILYNFYWTTGQNEHAMCNLD